MLLGIVFAATATSATLDVPGTYATIQAAIDAAVNGDTVMVDPGTYYENINFLGKAITVTSSGGAAVTVIDANNSGSVVTCTSGEGLDSVLDGFTITNGKNGSGSGVMCGGSSPTIQNNIIKGNVGSAGVGIGAFSGSPDIKYNTITENDASVLGGGIFINSSSALIEGNTIYNNRAGAIGGAINCSLGSPTIVCNLIYDNQSDMYGGGIGCDGNDPQIYNNVIWGNNADANGGGINFKDATPTVMNNTFYGNTGVSHGGAIAVEGTSAVTVTNSILWNDFSPYGMEIWIDTTSATITVECCDVMMGYVGDGNLDQDPLFADEANDDFHLTWLSPCVNRGTNSSAPADDMDGDARPCQGTVDMGADEYAGVHALEADAFTIAQPTGGVVNLALDAGTAQQGRKYFVLGGVTGTTPGMALPLGMAILPLNWDVFTDLVLTLANTPVMSNFYGNLDASGTAAAQIDTIKHLPPNTVGVVMHYAYVLYYPFDFASNPIAVEITP
jgi:hypothetical protein